MYCPKCAGEFNGQTHRVYHAAISKYARIPKSARKPTLDDYDTWAHGWDCDPRELPVYLEYNRSYVSWEKMIQPSEAHMRPHELETYRAVVAAQLV